EVINRVAAATICALHEQVDRHLAHRLAGRLVSEAVAEAGLVVFKEIWAYEIWGLFPRWDRLEYIDAHITKKMMAIAEHRSQVASIPYGEGVLGLNRWRAAV